MKAEVVVAKDGYGFTQMIDELDPKLKAKFGIINGTAKEWNTFIADYKLEGKGVYLEGNYEYRFNPDGTFNQLKDGKIVNTFTKGDVNLNKSHIFDLEKSENVTADGADNSHEASHSTGNGNTSSNEGLNTTDAENTTGDSESRGNNSETNQALLSEKSRGLFTKEIRPYPKLDGTLHVDNKTLFEGYSRTDDNMVNIKLRDLFKEKGLSLDSDTLKKAGFEYKASVPEGSSGHIYHKATGEYFTQKRLYETLNFEELKDRIGNVSISDIDAHNQLETVGVFSADSRYILEFGNYEKVFESTDVVSGQDIKIINLNNGEYGLEVDIKRDTKLPRSLYESMIDTIGQDFLIRYGINEPYSINFSYANEEGVETIKNFTRISKEQAELIVNTEKNEVDILEDKVDIFDNGGVSDAGEYESYDDSYQEEQLTRKEIRQQERFEKEMLKERNKELRRLKRLYQGSGWDNFWKGVGSGRYGYGRGYYRFGTRWIYNGPGVRAVDGIRQFRNVVGK